jgi:hypothetical protein
MKICLFTNYQTTELETLIYKLFTIIKKRETKKKADNKSESAQSFYHPAQSNWHNPSRQAPTPALSTSGTIVPHVHLKLTFTFGGTCTIGKTFACEIF